MNPADKSRSGGRREPQGSAKEADIRNKTPNTDMQPEDAGTPESGNTGRGTAAEGVLKQTSKTKSESENQTLSMGLRGRCPRGPPARPCPDRTVASALVLHSKAAATDRMCIGLA